MESSKNIPTVFIIFGATGDLMAKKIAPALLNLYISGKFPKLFKIIAFSRHDFTFAEFQSYLREILKSHKDKRITNQSIEDFLQYFVYQKGNFDTVDAYNDLSKKLGRIDDEWKACSNKLFYLAVPPSNYKSIFEHLKTSGLTLPCGPDEGWTRVIVEKPFGKDAKTALELDTLLSKLFKEEQIYRIDHYLGKDMLQNILSFRFNNDLFDNVWDRDHIEKIEIKFLENIGIAGRTTFYDGVGALRDVGQNHMLQMLAFVTMEQPASFTADAVRDKRAEILKTLTVMDEAEVKAKTERGQFEGYTKLDGVMPNSNTETYFKIEASLVDPKWEGIPIILEAGKKVERKKEIAVTFKHREPCLCASYIDQGGRKETDEAHFKNRIIFSLEPKEEITIEFWAKKPGLDFIMEKEKLSFLFKDERKKEQYVREYEKLLLDCILGNQISFVSTDEVNAMWRFVDPIVEAWEKNVVPLKVYKPRKSIK